MLTPFLIALALAAGTPAAGSGPAATNAASAAPSAVAGDQQPTTATTVLRFSPERFDLGEMISGKPKSAVLTVTNTGKTSITVESIKGSCGCTTIKGAPTAPVAAGASFTVEITVDPGAKTGVDLAKTVFFQLDGGRIQNMTVYGHVKTVVQVSPDVIDGSQLPAGAAAVVTLESLDQGAFSVTAIEPANLVDVPKGKSSRHTFSLDFKKWEAAGRPTKLTVKTDKVDAETLIIPVKGSDAVVLYRLPAAPSSSPEREALEAAQDDIIRALDARLPADRRSKDFRFRLHRETGMLFVHGTPGDAANVRDAVGELPDGSKVREAGHE